MRLVFCGTPQFAVPTLQTLHAAGHEIALVARPIAIDAKPELEDFSSWYVDPPGCAGPVFAICRCPCGSPWARLDDDGNLELRIGFEWRGRQRASGPQPSGGR